MSLLDMSLAGGAMVLAVVLARALLLNKLPKMTFVVLWALIAIRLLVPVAVPSPLSVATLVHDLPHETVASGLSSTYPVSTTSDTSPDPVAPPSATSSTRVTPVVDLAPTEEPQPTPMPQIPWDAVIPVIWAAGALACTCAFAITYLRCRREFATSLPVGNEHADAWLTEHQDHLRRPLALRQSDRIATPLTYGVLKPVILVPKTCNWEDGEQMRFMLAHEFVHVRRFDAALKLVFVACVCVHWFNPLVWAFYVLANRDLELSCDESVVRSFGTDSRATYARTLIAMEETKTGLAPLYSGFSKTATEERIVAIMHIKKASFLALATSASLVIGIPAALATSAASPTTPAPLTAVDASTAEKPSYISAATGSGIDWTSLDTSDWNRLSGATYCTPDDWKLVEALNVPGVEDLTVTEFTKLALSVANTPEKVDTLLCLMDDADIRSQTATNGAAYFVARIMAPVLLENSAFTSGGTVRPYTFDADWTGVFWLESTDAVVTDGDGDASLASALAEDGYTGGQVCYMLNAHVLDAEKLTVGAYANALADAERNLDALVSWNLASGEGLDAGKKLQTAMDDIAQNQSSDELLIEAAWFFIEDASGVAVFSDGSAPRDTDALEAALVNYDVVMDDGANNSTYVLLDTYKELGFSWDTGYHGALTMEFNGSPVRSVFDEKNGVYIASSLNAEGVDLVAVYKDGQLSGLRTASEGGQIASSEVVTGTASTASPDLDALNASYEAFGLSYDAGHGIYVFEDVPVRYLFDGYVIDTNDDGSLGSYVTILDSYNADGAVDVCVLREPERNADGSVDRAGDIVDVREFSSDEGALVEELIANHLVGIARADNGVSAEGTFAEAETVESVGLDVVKPADQEAVAEGNETGVGHGLTVAERLEPFGRFGLVLGNDGALSCNGEPVNAFVDWNGSGVFSYSSPVQSKDGLYLRAVYDSDGALAGLKEFDPSAAFAEE